MNKEQQELLDEVYERYSIIAGMSTQVITLTKEEFIHYIRTDTEFSKTWGLKIEERELSMSERGELFRKTYPRKSVDDFAPSGMEVQSIRHQLDTRYENASIPTKLITTTYNDKIITSYE